MITIDLSRIPNCYDHLHNFNCPWDVHDSFPLLTGAHFPIPNDDMNVWLVSNDELQVLLGLLEEDSLELDYPEEMGYLGSL